MRRTPTKRFPPEVLSPEEVQPLLGASGGEHWTRLRDRALIAVLYRSGLRISEALELRPKDLDLAQGMVRVLRGKGGYSRTVGIDPGRISIWWIFNHQMNDLAPCSIATSPRPSMPLSVTCPSLLPTRLSGRKEHARKECRPRISPPRVQRAGRRHRAFRCRLRPDGIPRWTADPRVARRHVAVAAPTSRVVPGSSGL